MLYRTISQTTFVNNSTMPIDYSIYPPNWKDEIRPRELKKAGFKCAKCKVRHKVYGYRNSRKVFVECDDFMIKWAKDHNLKIIRIILTVAHLDHDPENWDNPRLMVLCQQCHNQYDAPQRALNRKLNRKKLS